MECSDCYGILNCTRIFRKWSQISGARPLAGSDSNASQESHFMSTGSRESDQGLNHVDGSEQAMMVDVSSKEDSKRVAVAACKLLLAQKAFYLVASNQVAKGDVLNVANTAGINGAKQTSKLVPSCRNISLTQIRVDFSAEMDGEATTTGRQAWSWKQ